jgi:anthranilate phosphoribosyltransferase
MPNDILTEALQEVTAGRDLSEQMARRVVGEMMDGRAGEAQTAAVLAALRAKGEIAAEIVGFARAMTERAARIDLDADVILDTCGTGGDGAGTFNISTAAALVAAGAGALVAKHGNRSATGSCGSADVLEALGVRIDLPPDLVAECVRCTGIGFLFAPLHHASMARVAPVRRELGIRTIFNLVGPLTNPAGARHQLIGVADEAYVDRIAEAVRTMGCARNLVVRSQDGLDELSTTSVADVVEVLADRDEDRRFTLAPEDVGLARAPLAELLGGDAQRNADIVTEVLDGAAGPRLDVVLLNAGAALYTAEAAVSIAEGVELARTAVATGAARAKLDALRETTQALAAGSREAPPGESVG